MANLALIYRKNRVGRNSIENVFRPLEELPGVERIELPCDLHSLGDLIRLCAFAIQMKKKNVHITGDVHYMAFLLFRNRSILTVHDCNHYENLTGLRRYLMGLIWYKLPIMACHSITVISPFVKDQLLSHFKTKKPIHVIPNSFIPVPILAKKKPDDKIIILTIGSMKIKNIERLVDAVCHLSNYQLRMIGKLSDSILRKLKEYNIDYLNEYNLTREQLNEAYNASDILYFASTKEGFGLPILEAQSCGLPVITSNVSSMPFVAGEGAYLVNPFSVDEIKEAIIRLGDDEELRQILIEKGLANIDRFGREGFKTKFLSLYKEVFTNN